MDNLIAKPGGMPECMHAFFPGCLLAEFEPELVVKMYDSLRFQDESMGFWLECCDDATLETWESLGRPTLIMPCMDCMVAFNKVYPEIPTITAYRFIRQHGISGGCNSVDYVLATDCADDEDVRALAEDMGVTLYDSDDVDPGELPYITASIGVRNALKEQGKDAVHILEMIYGMGDSNAHMVHEHDHEDEDREPESPKPESAPLPDEMSRASNRSELIKAMEMLFFS